MSRIRKAEAACIRATIIAKCNAIDTHTAPRKGVNNRAEGDAFELSNARYGSTKTAVSLGGKADNYVSIIDSDGKKRRYELESKINGGRIDTLLDKVSRGRKLFVAYKLNICNSTTGNKPRQAEAVIVPAELFVSKLKEFGAIKEVRAHGEHSGYAIQPSSKTWWAWLVDYPVKWDVNESYEWWMFEGLE